MGNLVVFMLIFLAAVAYALRPAHRQSTNISLSERGMAEHLAAAAGRNGDEISGRVEPREFSYGLEYLVPGRAQEFSPIGADWIKVSLVDWGRFEPEPPRDGRHTYQFAEADRVIAEYQAAGFTHLMLVLKCRSPWATMPLKSQTTAEFDPSRSTPPKPQHWDDYAAWVEAIVRRYDGDGVDDMPGLRAPILHLEIESEAQHAGYWQGSLAEYGRLLRTAYQAAKRANPQCLIILAGIALSDGFDDLPESDVVQKRFAKLSPAQRKSLKFVRGMLRFQDAFDLVEFHYNYDPQGIYGIVNFLRAEMRQAGTVKPIWAGDAAVAPMLDARTKPAYTAAEAPEVAAALENRAHPRHAEFNAKHQALQAGNVVKKVILSLDVGLAGIMVGNLEDWPGFHIQNKSWVWQGLVNADRSPRPVFFAYQQLRRKLAGVHKVIRLGLGPGTYGFEIHRSGSPLYVLWATDGIGTLALPVEFSRARITSSVTFDRQGLNEGHVVSANQGMLFLPLTSTPLYVENADALERSLSDDAKSLSDASHS